MLTKFFNILRSFFGNKTKKQDQDSDILASISYYIKKDDPSVIIDAEMYDYDESSAVALSRILNILSQDACYVETVNMLRTSFEKDGEYDLLLYVLTHVSQAARDKIIEAHRESVKDEPCIKPSDML